MAYSLVSKPEPSSVDLMVPGLSLKNYINGFTSTELTNVIFTCLRRNFLWSFDNQKNLDYIVKGGTCSWGRPSLFVTPWFPTFDATTMVVMKMSVRIRLHNLPFPFWHHQVLEGIGNSLGEISKDGSRKNGQMYFYVCPHVHGDRPK